jgi:hypothetical protein
VTFSFEEHFYSKASVIPELSFRSISKLSSWRKDDIALALYGTKIVSLRILQEFDQTIEKVHHVVESKSSMSVDI